MLLTVSLRNIGNTHFSFFLSFHNEILNKKKLITIIFINSYENVPVCCRATAVLLLATTVECL